MTQTYTQHSSIPLPDAFSAELTEMFTTVQPSIVQVHTEGRGAGTGIIWNEDGYIITNNHVVAKDNAKVQVFLSDGRTLDAKVLQRNARLDLALLKATGEHLKPLCAGDSAKLRVGEWVFAVGHPWGQRWVVTAGIVSAQRTAKLADDVTTQYIQSDVLLAPGNSGGPLLNTDGNVVGINAMIFGGDLSVAIPSNVVTTWLAGLTKRTLKLGIAVQTVELSEALRQSFNTQQTSGLLIVGIEEDRQVNDLLIGDIILTVAEKPVHDAATLRHMLAQQGEAKTVALTLVRAGAIVSLEAMALTVGEHLMIRVFVIATTPMQQAGLRVMLTSPEIEIVSESLVPDTALEELSESDVIVVADEVLLEDAVRMLPSDETVSIVVMANNERKAFSLLRSLKVRSWGIIPASASASYLQGATLAVAQGSVVFPGILMRDLHEGHLHMQPMQLEAADEVLTTREREVLELVSQGLSNKLIARNLQISEHTVKFHISSVSSKLGAASRTDAVRLGLRKGLITL